MSRSSGRWARAHKETGDYAMLPTHVTDKDGLYNPAYLTPKANGINCLSETSTVLRGLALSELPSSLLQHPAAACLEARDAEWIALREFELYSVLQMLARGNSRRFDRTRSGALRGR